MDLDAYRRTADSFTTELMREYYRHYYAGLNGLGLRAADRRADRRRLGVERHLTGSKRPVDRLEHGLPVGVAPLVLADLAELRR